MGVKVREKPKGSGIYWVFINFQGKRKSKRIGKSKKVANEVAKKITAKLVLGDFGFDDKKTYPLLSEFATSWIEKTVPATCKESTESDYRAILNNHILPHFGNIEIDKLNVGMIKDFLFSKVNSGLSSSTITHMKNVISGVLSKAVDDKILLENPTLNLGKSS